MSNLYEEHMISFEDKDLIIHIREKYGQDLSALAFETFFIWRKYVGGKIYLEDEMYSLNYTVRGENTWTFPCGDKTRCHMFIERHFNEDNFSLCYMREQDKRQLEEWFPDAFVITASPEDSEYILDRKQQNELKGKKYAKLRGKIHKAKASYKTEIQVLSDDNLQKAVEITQHWHQQRNSSSYLKMKGNEEDLEPLMNYKKMELYGILLYLDNKPFGIAAGYPLSGDTYDLFLAKEIQNLPGLGYYLKYVWMQQLPESCKYVNLEDDLGIEGLRTMKKQMIPVKKHDLWSARRKLC